MPENLNELPTNELGEFFDSLWHETIGYVYLPTLNREANIFDQVMYHWPEHRKQVIQHVLVSTAKGLEVYCAPALFKKAEKTLKENVLGSWVVWAEYDGSVPTGWSDDASEGGSVAPVPAPSLIIQSSAETNLHAYWELEDFETDTEWIENTNRSITYSTRADTSGWDCTQILRPPNTRNYKYDDSPLVSIAFSTHNKYNRTRFAGLPEVEQLVSDSIDVDNLPSVGKIVARYQWSDEDFEFFDAASIPEGQRSDALMRLGYIGAEMGLSDSEIYAILNYADNKWKKYIHRRDRKGRLLDIINRAKTKHPHAIDANFAGLTGDNVKIGHKYYLNAEEFRKEKIDVTWAIEDFIEVGGMGMIASSPGLGKTQLSLQLAICCILGKPFFDWKIPRKMRIAFFSLEMSRVSLHRFLETILEHYTDDEQVLIDENLILLPFGEALPLSAQGVTSFVDGLIEEIKPDGIIVDSFGKLTMSKMDEEVVKKLNHELGLIRKRHNCFVWLIHHNRKATEGNKGTFTLDDIYGSVYITAEQSMVLLLWKGHSYDKDKIKVFNVKNRLAEEHDPFFVSRDKHLFFTVTDSAGSRVSRREGNDDNNGTPPDQGKPFLNF